MPTDPLYVIRWVWKGDQETPYITGLQGDAPLPAHAVQARCTELNNLYPLFYHWPEKYSVKVTHVPAPARRPLPARR